MGERTTRTFQPKPKVASWLDDADKLHLNVSSLINEALEKSLLDVLQTKADEMRKVLAKSRV